MTGVELEKYLMESKILKDENVYIVEDIDGELYRVPSCYSTFLPISGKLKVRIYYNKYSDNTKWVDFSIDSNLYACHKLKEMTFETLYLELNKIIGSDTRFIEWSTKELRNYRIDLIT